ncbi:MAG: hypothetical protein Q9195_002113 [Heterodermia aff. obscurata]
MFRTTRRVLGNISNRGGPIPSSQQGDRSQTSPASTASCPGNCGSTRIGPQPSASIRRRQFSKQYGDLSRLRPVSPPLPTPTQHQDSPLLSPGKYIEDIPSQFHVEGTASQQESNLRIGDYSTQSQSHAATKPLPSTPVSKVSAPSTLSALRLMSHECTNKCDYETRPLPLTPTRATEDADDSGGRAYQRNENYTSSLYHHEKAPILQTSSIRKAKPYKHQSSPIQAQSLGHDEWYHPADVFVPIHQTFPPLGGQELSAILGLGFIHAAPPVDHLSISTTWKGLNWFDAEQLLRIHQTFRTTVNSLLANQVAELQKSLDRPSKGFGLTAFTPLDGILRRRCSLSWSLLVCTMKRSLGFVNRDDETRSGDIDLLYLYLSTVDCFQFDEGNESRGGSIDFILKHHENVTVPLLQPVVEATWLPDYLSFPGVSLFPREGEQLVIVPFYRNHANCGLRRFQDGISYGLGTELPWLEWDQTMSGWKGIIPRYSEIRDAEDDKYGKVYRTNRVGGDTIVNLLRIDVMATRRETLHSGVQVERIVRARLTIKVKPCWARDRTVSNISQGQLIESLKDNNPPSPVFEENQDDVGSSCDNNSSEQAGGVFLGRVTPSMNHWASRSQQFEQEVMSKVRDGQCPSVKTYPETDSKKSHPRGVDMITDVLAQYGPVGLVAESKAPMVHDTDIQAYPMAISRVMEKFNTHRFANPSTPARHLRRSNFSYARRRDHKSSSTSALTDQHAGFSANIQASMSVTKRTHELSASENPASPVLERTPLEELRRLPQRPITPQSTIGAFSDCSFRQREIHVQPASAELFAIAQTLHHQPTDRKRVTTGSFEHSPAKRMREVSDYTMHSSNDSGYCSDNASQSAYQSTRDTSKPDESDDLSLTPTSPVALMDRYAVFAGHRSGAVMNSDEALHSSRASRVSSSRDPYNDACIQQEQCLLLRNALREAEGCSSPRERKDIYEALKRSMQDSERMSHERLGIHLSQAFTDSEATDIDWSSDNGVATRDEIAETVSNNHEGTESLQSSSSHELSPHNETYRRCLAVSTHVGTGKDETESEYSYQSESSDFIEHPSFTSDSSAPVSREHNASKSTCGTSKVPENRSTPLMGFFGAGPTARGRNIVRGPRVQPRSTGTPRRSVGPKCYGCEARGSGRLENGEVKSGAVW